MKDLSMTLSSENVLLVDGKGTLTASVHNASSDDERVVLGAFPPTDAPATGSPAPTWATVEKPLRSIAPEATEQYEVSFDTTGAAPGTYPVKLIPYSADEAPEDYADLAHIVTLEVPKPKPGPVPPPKWWIYVAAAAVVLLLIGVTVFLLTRAPSPTLELTGFQPGSGPTAGGTEVTLVGRFAEPTVVRMSGMEIPATRISDTEYTFMTPAAAAGQARMIVESNGERVGVGIYEYVDPIRLTGITITSNSPPLAADLERDSRGTVTLNTRASLIALGSFSDGSTAQLPSVVWESEFPLQVDPDGRLRPSNVGRFAVTAIVNGITATVIIQVDFF
jgi:hypothetical protein